MTSVSMMRAVHGYCENQGYLEAEPESHKSDPKEHIQALLGHLSDEDLGHLMRELAEMDESGFASDRILDLLERVEIMMRCDRILPGL